MRTITLEELKKLDNPRGLSVVHDVKNPSICTVVDAEGELASPKKFSNRGAAEFEMYQILVAEDPYTGTWLDREIEEGVWSDIDEDDEIVDSKDK